MSPLYEYLCDHCNFRFDAFNTVENRDNSVCPNCRKEARKLFSTFNFTFGWVLSERSHEKFGPKEEFIKNI